MRRTHVSPLLPLLTAAVATLAGAETSPYYLGASQTFSHNTNLLGLGDGQAAPAGLSRSDTVSSTALLAGLDQPVGRQRLFGDLALRSNRMSSNDIYDNQGYTLGGGIDWATIENLSGSVRASVNRSLASFNSTEIGLLTKKNLQTTQQFDTTVRLGVVTAWTAEGGVGLRRVDYSAAEYAGREFRQNSVWAGLRYRPSAASSFGAALRNANGRYPRFRTLADGSFEADRYSRRDLDLTATLAPSAASDVDLRISLGATRYDVATQRDFSGLTGRLGWGWRPTGKLRLRTELTREPGQDSYFLGSSNPDATVDYSRLTTALRLRADYAAAAKVALNASIGVARRSLTRTLAAAAGSTQDSGSDRRTDLAIGASWTPSRSVALGCDLGRLLRRGNPPLSSNLHATTYSCYGQFTLQ